MFELSLPKLVLIALVVLVLFGRGKVAELMGEFGKGVKNFKEGMDDATKHPASPPTPPSAPTQIAPTHPPVTPAMTASASEPAPPAQHG